MGGFTYEDGIAVVQLIIFPFILAAAVFIWKRTGWKAGSKIWRYGATLSLIRIVGSICLLLTIDHESYNLEVAVAVCELIGLAPLLMIYIGLLRQIDTEHRLPPRGMTLMTILGFLGLILGITGVSIADDRDGAYTPDSIVKASMGIFLALFVILLIMAAWLWSQLHYTARNFQRKLFFAIIFSCPFVLVRLVYSAISDYTSIKTFSILEGDPTTYLCMDVLEEIVAMVLIMSFGMLAVAQDDFTKMSQYEMSPDSRAGQAQA